MSNTWFRFYHDTLNNAKAQKLSPEAFKGWVNMLCMASQNGGVIIKTDLPFSLRCDESVTDRVVQELISADLILEKKGNYVPKNWDKRQYKSDSSAERTRRYRDKLRDVTETPSDTDTDTEQKDYSEGKPSSSTMPKIDFDFLEGKFTGITNRQMMIWKEAYPACDVMVQIRKAAVWMAANPKKKKKNYAAFLANWLTKAQERGGDIRAERPISLDRPARKENTGAITV